MASKRKGSEGYKGCEGDEYHKAYRFTDMGVQNAKRIGTHFDTATVGLGLKVSAKRKIWIMQLVWPS